MGTLSREVTMSFLFLAPLSINSLVEEHFFSCKGIPLFEGFLLSREAGRKS